MSVGGESCGGFFNDFGKPTKGLLLNWTGLLIRDSIVEYQRLPVIVFCKLQIVPRVRLCRQVGFTLKKIERDSDRLEWTRSFIP